MIDGLRGDFPQVFALARRVPNPRFARTSPLWAVLAAFGVGFFVSAVVTILLSFLLGSTTRETPLPRPFEVGRLASTAAALAVALIAGGRVAVAGYVGIVVLERLLGLPSQLRFCGDGADPNLVAAFCSVSAYAATLWPELLGAALAFALVRWLRPGAGDRNPPLEAAGVFVVVQGVGGSLLNAALGPSTAGSLGWPLLLFLVAIAAGIAMGFTILRRSTRRWRTLGVIAFVLVADFVILSLPTLVSQVFLARGTNLLGPFDLLVYFSPVFVIAAAAVILYMAAARKVTGTAGA